MKWPVWGGGVSPIWADFQQHRAGIDGGSIFIGIESIADHCSLDQVGIDIARVHRGSEEKRNYPPHQRLYRFTDGGLFVINNSTPQAPAVQQQSQRDPGQDEANVLDMAVHDPVQIEHPDDSPTGALSSGTP